MTVKSLLMALSNFTLGSNSAAASPERNLLEIMTTTVRKQILEMAFKVLIGLVLVSVIVFSVFRVGEALHNVLSALENVLVFECVIFGGIALVGLFLLYFLFYGASKVPLAIEANRPISLELPNLQDLVVVFAEGFIKGLNLPKQDTPE